MRVTIHVLTHPLVTFGREGALEGHFILLHSNEPLHHVLSQMAGEPSLEAALKLMPNITRDEVQAVMHFTGARMAEMDTFPPSAFLAHCPDVEDASLPCSTRVVGTQVPIAQILASLGDTLSVEQVLQRHSLTADQLAMALAHASVFLRAHRSALLEEVRRLSPPPRSEPEPVKPNQNVFRLPKDTLPQ